MNKIKIPLIAKIIIAIILGVACSYIFPTFAVRIFVTLNSIFGNFLGFSIPLIILGLVAPGIAQIGRGAGRLLAITAAIAYLSTLISGFFSYFTSRAVLPSMLSAEGALMDISSISSQSAEPYFTIDMPPVMGVTSALVLAFILGLGLAAHKGSNFKGILVEFRDLTMKLIQRAIIPFLPLYIFGIFLKIGYDGQVGVVLGMFLKVIAVIFVMHIVLLLAQFMLAGAVARRNPLRSLLNMMPAYLTALGTQSSAATIPVTLEQVKKNGVNPELAGFVVPLCATIHLAGSILKITACAFAISYILGLPIDLATYAGFIAMLGITMVAAPGVPGGAIMAALGLLGSMLHFDATAQALMIALYITMDSFGTACNVTGDGAIAMIVNAIASHGGAKRRSE